jgi:cystathionine beta-lyase
MTHKTIPAEKRKAAGVTDSLIRLSTGLEDTEDLIADLRQALDRLAVTVCGRTASGGSNAESKRKLENAI